MDIRRIWEGKTELISRPALVEVTTGKSLRRNSGIPTIAPEARQEARNEHNERPGYLGAALRNIPIFNAHRHKVGAKNFASRK